MKKKLLLVDDDDHILVVASFSLEDTWVVLTASSGAEAIEIAAREIPNVILLDMMMPEMNGATTLQILRQNKDLCNVPIIFMTAKVQKHQVEGYLVLGAAGVIAKPFDPMRLSAQICQLIEDAMVSR